MTNEYISRSILGSYPIYVTGGIHTEDKHTTYELCKVLSGTLVVGSEVAIAGETRKSAVSIHRYWPFTTRYFIGVRDSGKPASATRISAMWATMSHWEYQRVYLCC